MLSCAVLATSLAIAHGSRMSLNHAEDQATNLALHLVEQENATLNKICHQERFWPPELAKKFPNGKMVGSGATACVAIADYKGGKVALKVGKKNSNLKEWQIECAKLQRIRLESCKAGVLDMHEQYIPTCTDVGQVSFKGEKINYYVMHAASVEGVSQVGKNWNPSQGDRKTIAAELVASIYAMHKTGYAHNDLHGNNIVVNQKTLALQLIDLGDAANYPGWIKDYKRDSNAVWRWLAVLAGCDDQAQWFSHLKGVSVLKKQAENFKTCIETAWNPGADFMAALATMLDGCTKNARKHNVEALYNSAFIQKNKPKKALLFPADHTAGCQGWDSATWETKEMQAEFANHYKCDTVPSYKSKGRKGKETVQCARGRPKKAGGDGHCFAAATGVMWGCGGATDWDGFKGPNKPCNEMGKPGGGYFDGGCLTTDHPGYRVAQTWKR